MSTKSKGAFGLFPTEPRSYLDRENLERGERAKEDGISKVASNNKDFLERARVKAVEVASANRSAEWPLGRVTIDDLRKYFRRIGVEPKHQNAWGAVFKDGKTFTALGFESSATPSRNSGIIRIWGLK